MPTPEEPEKTFKFTRHVLSCNNIGAGKGQEIFLIKKISGDYEPGLSHSGILETLEYVKEHREDFESCDVCVSNLYRTWCTAVILYGNGLKKPSSQGMIHYLNLWICPHLKEEHKTEISMRQNGPKPIDHMVKKFKKFLDTLMIIINNDQNKYTDFHFPNRIYLNLSTSNLSIMYTKSEKKEKKPYYYSYSNEYDEKDNEYYKKDKDNKWLKTGNLSTFMDWFNNNFTEKEKFKNEKVHVVTHSNVMQNYLKELSLNKLKEKYDHEGRFCFTKKSHKPYYTKVTEKNIDFIYYTKVTEKNKNIDFIGKTNCWSFETKPSFLGEIQDYFNKNNLLSKKISDILSNKISIHDMIIELNQYNANSITHLISILSSIKMGVKERPDANKIEKDNKNLSLCGKYKQKTKKGGKLKRNKITRKRRNTRTRKKGIVKRGGCYREPIDDQEKMIIHINDPNTQKQINEIYPPWDEEKELEKAIIMDYTSNTNLEYVKKIWEEDQKPYVNKDTEKRREIAKKIKQYDREELIIPILSGEIRTINLNIPDDHKAILDYMKKAKSVYDQSEAMKDEIMHFVKTYSDKTYLEYIAFSSDINNLCTFNNCRLDNDKKQNEDILILDTNGQPFPRDSRYTLPNEPRVKLWNILHEKNPELLTETIFTNIDNKSYDEKYKEKHLQVIQNPYNPKLKQNIEEYINSYPNKTYEDWIKQDNIFKKYVIDESHIFSIMYLEKHPALHYWNEYSKNENNSKNLVTHRTKENKDSTKPNDHDTYVYKIENKKP